MNKKFSTLALAALVAAGYTMNAEAGVVKVATPLNGRSYVVAQDGLIDLSTNTKDQLKDNTTAPQFTDNSGAAAPDKAATGLWKFIGSETDFALQNQANYLEYTATTGRYNTAVSANTQWAYNAATGIISLKSDGTKQIERSGAPGTQTVGFAATGTALYFYAVTENVTTVALTHVKFNGKWLVATSATAVELVDDATLEAYKLANPTAAQWKVTSSNGKYESVSQAGKFLKVNAGVFELDGTGAVFEENAIEGLFGATNASGKFEQLIVTNSGAIQLKETPAATDTKVTLEREEVTPSAEAATSITVAGTTYALANEIANEYYLLTSKSAVAAYYLSQADDNTAAKSVAVATAPDKYAYWKVSGNKTDGYTFKNLAGVTLKVDGVSSFKSDNAYKNGFIIYGLDSDGTTKKYMDLVSGGALTLNASGTGNDVVFGLYKLGDIPYTAGELTSAYNTYFDLLLKDTENGTADLEGNPFGNLIPMKVVDVKDASGVHKYYDLQVAPAGETSYLFKRTDGNYMILDLDETWSSAGISNHVDKGGYKFGILSGENMSDYINGTAIDELQKRNLAYTFQIAHASEMDNIKYVSVQDKDNKIHYLVTFNANGNTYLTVNNTLKNGVYAALQNKTMVHGSDGKNNPLLDQYVNIQFANHPSINYTTEDGNRAMLDGKVLGMRRDNVNAPYPAEASKFLFGKPEGQWIVKMTVIADKTAKDLKNGTAINSTNDVRFTFVNRENPNATYSVDRMFYLGDNKYAVERDVEGSFSKNGVGRDTLIIKGVDVENDVRLTDGYKVYTDADIQDKEYKLILNSTSNVDYYVSENHGGKHLLGISTKATDAVNWRLVRMDRATQLDADGYAKYATDSIYVQHYPQYYKGGKYYANSDTLAMVTYALQNTSNGEYMTYEGLQSQDILSMMCKENSENYLEHLNPTTPTTPYLDGAYRFVIKEKEGDLINVLGVSGVDGKYGYSLDLNKKLYGASTKNTVEVEKAYTQINSNDLFRLDLVNAPIYRKMAQNDTIRIFRSENEFDTMYENGKFLNLGNSAQLKDMAPALYVDTAYVNRGTNNCYQYLVVVNPDRKDATYDNKNHLITPDTTYGRFLINYIDSAVYTNKHGEIHNNIFINDKEADETYVKTGFEWGYRTGNKLYLTDGDNFKKVNSVIDLNSADFNIAKFAFRYVNPSSNDEKGAFKIQTRYVDYNSAIKVADQKARAEHNNGYLKTINGVVVVTNGYAKGEVFNLAAEKSAPTSNDQIGTSEVSIIAGAGSVVVKGAAGKSVAISNILGQTIAETVLTSDNATIAVPAGIVVVAVEGEEAVKTVVK